MWDLCEVKTNNFKVLLLEIVFLDFTLYIDELYQKRTDNFCDIIS